MYKYLYGVGRRKDYQPGFRVVDIDRFYIKDLGKVFTSLYIVIEDSLYKTKFAIELDTYRLEFENNLTMNIQEWLDTKSQVVLKKAPVTPGNVHKYVKAERLFVDGYFHYPADLNLAKDRQNDLLADTAPDIRIRHYAYDSGVDYRKQVEYSLFVSNGVFYRAVGKDDGIYLVGAGSDYIYSKRDVRIGALNFQKLGKIKTIPITSDMLYKVPTNAGTRWKIKVPDEKLLAGKTHWMVLNGKLVVDPDILYQVSAQELMMDPKSLDVMEHFQTYNEYERTPKLNNMTKFDTYVRDALVMHNSFLVLIDNPTLGVEVTPLTTFHYPNVLHTEERFQHPVMLENGLFPTVYPRSYGIKQRLLNHDVRIKRKYPIQTSGTLAGNNYNAMAINQGDPGHLPKGYFFKIFGVTFESA